MNYFQTIGITIYFDLKLPSYLDDFFNNFAIIGNYSTDSLTIECIAQEFGISLKPVYLKLCLLLFLPLLVLLLIIFLLLSLKFCFLHKIKDKIILSIIIVCVLVQSSVAQALFDNINYIEIDGEFLLIKEFRINFYSEEHRQWVTLKKITNSILYYIAC